MRAAAWAGAAVGMVASLLGPLGGCEQPSDGPATTGGGASGGATTTSTPTGTAAGVPCTEPDDGRCDEPADCSCTLCAPSALCQPTGEGCRRDGVCDPVEDACTCSDCDFAGRCFAGHATSCTLDGVCDFATEGCGCEDCWFAASCLDNHLACEGGAPDGLCDLDFEECLCNDCLGVFECLCPEPTECPSGACVCPGCWSAGHGFCSDAERCEDDGICAWDQGEGCHCADCQALALCDGFVG